VVAPAVAEMPCVGTQLSYRSKALAFGPGVEVGLPLGRGTDAAPRREGLRLSRTVVAPPVRTSVAEATVADLGHCRVPRRFECSKLSQTCRRSTFALWQPIVRRCLVVRNSDTSEFVHPALIARMSSIIPETCHSTSRRSAPNMPVKSIDPTCFPEAKNFSAGGGSGCSTHAMAPV
jgi:hypothetical protein